MADFDPGNFIDNLKDPHSLSVLSENDLKDLAQEVRSRIIKTVLQTGGHLAPSLGVVELTLSILSEFDINKDKLIWDVGHQSYAYKILTGRADKFDSLRTLGGISGFPRPMESPYDHFGVGHSSTSISAALGMALSRDLMGKNHHVIAVIGDGSLTGGEALEGLNLTGHMGKRLIVILNDNEMSISTNVGALSLFLSRTLSRRWIRQTRKEALEFLRGIPRIGQKLALYAMRGEWSFKSFFTPGMLFEAFRFNYIGPVDGHDIPSLRRHLQMAAAVEDGPVLLHVRTVKGKGYEPAETNPTLYHGVAHIQPGQASAKKPVTFTQVFGNTLTEMAAQDPKIIAITAAMPEGTGTDIFRQHLPERFVDTGICEQHAVTFAAGLASQGLKPFLAIYSTFLQRGYDQIVHDVCLQNLPVTFCIDRAGLVGEDGATHHGSFDIAYLRHIPNMSIIAPRDVKILRNALATARDFGSPLAIRYPKGKSPDVDLSDEIAPLNPGTGDLLKEGKQLLILAAGARAYDALEAAKIIAAEDKEEIAVFDPVWLKPLPVEQLAELASSYKKWLVVEEGTKAGGFGSAILEFLEESDLLDQIKIRRIGLPDTFIEHGTQKELRDLAGIGLDNIIKKARKLLRANISQSS